MTKITIGFDAKRIVRNATGLGNYCRTLVSDLSAAVPEDWRLLLYAPDKGRNDFRQQMERLPHTSFVYPERRPLSVERSLWRIGSIVNDLQRDQVQLYHGLTGELPRGIRRKGIPAVLTIHDLIFLRHPEFYHWIDAKIYAWKFRIACREAERIIAISECTKRDIMSFGGVDADRIDVVYQSCSPRFSSRPGEALQEEVRGRFGLPRHFLLSVGSIEERKNIREAVKALAYLPEEVHLVAVGKPTPYARRVLAEVRRTPLEQRVHFLHGVSDRELHALYGMAEVFVYPSRYEGFGIPIIEAIHSGLPVVAATGSCLEEAGGPDSLYVSPDDPRALAAAVTALFPGAEEREDRIRRSREYVRRFEGADVASQVIEVYRRVLSEFPSRL